MIEVNGLTKCFRGRVAVDGLSFQVPPGQVTGFLGPNGAGKSTTIRMIVGLDRPCAGTSSVNGRPYRRIAAPLREVGALLEAQAFHSGRTGYHHLLYLARSNGIDRRRVAQVLELVGLAEAARRRVKGFSLGMAQRLGLAAALLGDPAVLILDEPVNGLDAEGIRWLRGLLTDLAGQGRTVLLSSHLMSEMELVADRLVVIGAGRLIADTTMREFIEQHSPVHTLVRSPQQERLDALLRAAGASVSGAGAGARRVAGLGAAAIGELALAHQIALHELTPSFDSLEAVYTRLTGPAVRHRSADRGR
jgi:ABC-2 type transport system ATP-binding protein